MILMLPGNARAFRESLGHLCPEDYGWLLTPRRTMTKTGLSGLSYGVDNECFTLAQSFNPMRFVNALERIKQVHGLSDCRFIAAPDVPYDAQATLRRFRKWQPRITQLGFPVALVLQDGMKGDDLPWWEFAAVFVGGSTMWKLSAEAGAIMSMARQQGKWIHVGRVSSWHRVRQFRIRPDSVDGTHFTKRPDIYLRRWHNELQAERLNRSMFDDVVA